MAHFRRQFRDGADEMRAAGFEERNMHTVSRAEALDYPGPVIRRCGVKFSYDQSPHGIDAVARAAGENPVEIETELGIEEKNGYRGEQRQVQKKPSQNLGGKRKKNEETSFSRSITLL